MAGRVATQAAGAVRKDGLGWGVQAHSGVYGGLKAKRWRRREEAGKIDWDQIAKGLEFETERCAFNSLENGEMLRAYSWGFCRNRGETGSEPRICAIVVKDALEFDISNGFTSKSFTRVS